MPDLVAKISAFLDKHAMEPTAFGVLALNDSHFVHSLFKGKRKPRRATVRRVEDFMRNYKNGRRK